jgi:hypothetical protein
VKGYKRFREKLAELRKLEQEQKIIALGQRLLRELEAAGYETKTSGDIHYVGFCVSNIRIAVYGADNDPVIVREVSG